MEIEIDGMTFRKISHRKKRILQTGDRKMDFDVPDPYSSDVDKNSHPRFIHYVVDYIYLTLLSLR